MCFCSGASGIHVEMPTSLSELLSERQEGGKKEEIIMLDLVHLCAVRIRIRVRV